MRAIVIIDRGDGDRVFRVFVADALSDEDCSLLDRAFPREYDMEPLVVEAEEISVLAQEMAEAGQ